jgi:hypothetical protein
MLVTVPAAVCVVIAGVWIATGNLLWLGTQAGKATGPGSGPLSDHQITEQDFNDRDKATAIYFLSWTGQPHVPWGASGPLRVTNITYLGNNLFDASLSDGRTARVHAEGLPTAQEILSALDTNRPVPTHK